MCDSLFLVSLIILYKLDSCLSAGQLLPVYIICTLFIQFDECMIHEWIPLVYTISWIAIKDIKMIIILYQNNYNIRDLYGIVGGWGFTVNIINLTVLVPKWPFVGSSIEFSHSHLWGYSLVYQTPWSRGKRTWQESQISLTAYGQKYMLYTYKITSTTLHILLRKFWIDQSKDVLVSLSLKIKLWLCLTKITLLWSNSNFKPDEIL